MRTHLLAILCAVATSVALGLGACVGTPTGEPITVSVWTYYNGDQLSAFQNLVTKYNETEGQEKNVYVVASNVGSVEDLRDAVMVSASGKVGANPLPNAFMTYADTAYAIDQMGLLVDLAPYLTDEERAAYVEGYLEEGTLGAADSIKIFPVAKSCEVFVLNKTDFEPFAQATGASYDDLSTFEGVVRTAKAYYEWTDAQTPEEGDGKAFFGRDSMANYFYIGSKQLGTTLLSVEDGKAVLDFDKASIRKLWDNYYVPFVSGYFGAEGYYRSDDVKTGTIIALVGSSSGTTFFPKNVVSADGTQHEIEMVVLPCPQFEGGQPYAVQQGAGIAVINTTEEEIQATIDFLKWFSQPEQNIQFSVSSGYLPVMKQANTLEAVRNATEDLDENMEQILDIAMDEVANNQLYTPQACENGTAIRNVFEYSMKDRAAADAESVAAAIAQGTPREEALASYLSDKNFDDWYAETKAELEALL